MVAKRSLAQWRLLSTVIVGVVLACTVMAGTVVYFDALRELALDNTLNALTTNEKNILVKADRGPTTREEFKKVEDEVYNQVDNRVDWFLRGREKPQGQRPFSYQTPAKRRLLVRITPGPILHSYRICWTTSRCCQRMGEGRPTPIPLTTQANR